MSTTEAERRGSVEADPAQRPPRAAAADRPRREPLPDLVGPLPSLVAHWFLAALPAAVLGLTLVALALVRTPIFTAEAEVVVGRVDSAAESVPGYVAATQAQAADYSRLIIASQISNSLATTLRLPISEVAGHLAASPIPESAIIRIDATATSEGRAQSLADAGTTALISYVNTTLAGPAQAQQILDRFTQAQIDLANANAAIAAANAAIAQHGKDPSQLSAAEAALNTAQAAAASSQLQIDADANAYKARVQQLNGAPLSVVVPAHPAGDDRKVKVEDAAAIALVVGGVIGLALAMGVTNVSLLRALVRRARPAATD